MNAVPSVDQDGILSSLAVRIHYTAPTRKVCVGPEQNERSCAGTKTWRTRTDVDGSFVKPFLISPSVTSAARAVFGLCLIYLVH